MRPIYLGMAILTSAVCIGTAALTAPAPLPTRVETDQKTGEIRFFIKGKEEARIDGTGLKVRKDFTLGGTVINVDKDTYDTAAKHAP